MGFFNKLFGGQAENPWLKQGNDIKNECHPDTLSEAINCFNKAIDHDPQCVEAWHNKGHTYHLLRNEKEAVHCYEEAIKINPNYAEVWYNKGMSLSILKQDAEANNCFKKAQDIDPRYKEFINCWVYKITSPATSVAPGKFVLNTPYDPRKWSK